jgi:hypothetical protein
MANMIIQKILKREMNLLEGSTQGGKGLQIWSFGLTLSLQKAFMSACYLDHKKNRLSS